MLNDQSMLDVRNLITGKDGQLFITSSNHDMMFLAEVDSFTAQLSINNTDYQPVGSSLVYAVNTGYTVTLTLTEAVVRDNVMLSEIIKELQGGYVPSFDFTGKLRRKDGQVERITFRNCVPDSSVDLMNVTPGEIVKRSWSFRVNSTPEIYEAFSN